MATTTAIILSGAEICRLMRCNKVSIREMHRRTGLTMAGIRAVRERGLHSVYSARDWVQAITGKDPGPFGHAGF